MARRHEITGQGFTHQYLWNCATTLLTQPETKSPKDMYYAMAGMVMAYFTFEAYLNFVGSSVEPAAWKDERKVFSKRPYRGTEGKLKSSLCPPVKELLLPAMVWTQSSPQNDFAGNLVGARTDSV